ncbi:MAG: sulfur carrier protein ThiS [Motiliproteus sp.]|nr:sulfur carrier protein ThiS [Motiliproteus sp.]
MEIHLNGEPKQVKAASISELLDELGLAGKRLAVEYNLEILPKSEHQETRLQPQDKVEIVHAIGGG